MSTTIVDTPTNEVPEVEKIPVINEVVEIDTIGKYTATCKWFNDKLGFGFVTICHGPENGKDIFVHHSGIKPLNSIYKTLKKGEYINFNIVDGMNGLQAVDVTGINGGPLMCDHVIGRKMIDGHPQPPPPPPPPHQPGNVVWHQVPTTRRGPHPVANQTTPQVVKTKRYPPNTRPYKTKTPSSTK